MRRKDVVAMSQSEDQRIGKESIMSFSDGDYSEMQSLLREAETLGLKEENEEYEEYTEEEKAENDTEGTVEDSVKRYLQDIGQFECLTPEEERALGEKIMNGSPAEAAAARNRLVEANMRLAVCYARKFKNSTVSMEDLISMGNEGLIHAAEKFDYTTGNRFSTYAFYWIKQTVTRGVINEGNMVHIPIHMSHTIRKLNAIQIAIKQSTGREATLAELAKKSGLSEEKVKAALENQHTTVSMDAGMGEDGETTLDDFLKDEKALNPEDYIMHRDLTQTISLVLESLPPREASVLILRYGIGRDEPMTLDEIAGLPEFGISRERVRQIENNALRRIQSNRSLMMQLGEFAV